MQFSLKFTKLFMFLALSVFSLDSMAALITAAVGAPVNGAESETPDNGSFVIAIDNSPSSFINVIYSVTGSATPGADFVPFSGTATFSSGDSLSQMLNLAVLNDYLIEGPESVIITITNVTCGDCSDTGAIDNSFATTTMYIEDDDVALDVNVDLDPNDSLESVQVGLSCSNGSIHSTNPQSVNEPGPASFIVQLDDWQSPTTTCNASASSSSPNYDYDVSDCTGPVSTGGGSCTVYGTLLGGTETVTVFKDFLDDNTNPVNVTLSCPGATIENDTKPAAEGSPAVFSVSWDGIWVEPACTAIEVVPPGYTADETDCSNIAVFEGSGGSCTIVNTPDSVTETFTVFKDFLDDNDVPVDVTLTCPGATIDDDTRQAAEGSPAVFSVTWDGLGAEPLCTATESVPPDYTADETDCSAVTAFGGTPGSCTIINTPDTVTETFTVFKDFSDNNSLLVDVTLNCPGASIDDATQSAGEGSPAVFSVTWDGIGVAPACSATESVPPGYTANEAECTDVAAFGESPGSCTIVNTSIDGRVVVEKVYTDENDAEVQVSLTCTNATIENPQLSANPEAVFVLQKIGAGNTCTANETNVPDGYETDATDCADMDVGGGATFCKIYNSPIGVEPLGATLTVNKVFSDESATEVQISLECTAAIPDSATKAASMGNPAVFSLSNVENGNVCTATEAVVPGYEADESACASVSVADGAEANCTITNTLTQTPTAASFTVSKVFSDNSTADVQISLACTSASPDSATKSASMGSPAVFRLSNIESGNVCTATEAEVPGYEADESACAAVEVADGAAAGCTITNTLTETPTAASFTVNKVFSDESTAEVQISLACTAATPDRATRTATMGNPAVFSLSNIESGNVCTATEADVPGYEADESACASVAVTDGAAANCTITNTLTEVPASASFTVNTVFSDDSTTEVQVSLSCTAASPDSSTKAASMGNPAVFDLSNVEGGNLCTATGATVPGYDADSSACVSIAAPPGSSASCQISNEKKPGVTFTVNKFFSDGNKAEVQIGLTCTGADPDTASKQASIDSPAVFQLSNIVAGASCTATEKTEIAGYVKGETQCLNVSVGPENSGECTITNIEYISEPGSNDGGVGEPILNACPTGQNEGGFQEVCNGLVGAFLNGVPVDEALAKVTPDDAAAVRTTGMQTTNVQVSAVDGRIGTLRGGGGAGFSASGFNAAYGDLSMSGSLLGSFISSFDQNSPDFMVANAGQNDDAGFLDDFGRWGVWISGRVIFGKKDFTTNQIDYDFDTAGLTFGMDYRFNNEFVAGIAVGYANTAADIGRDDGDLDTKGYSVSLYGTYFQSDRFYMGGSLGYGSNEYDQKRNVRYDLGLANTPTATFNVDQTMAADYDGTQFSAAVNGGWDFNKNGWNFGPTFRVSYADVSVDGYDESLIRSNVPGYTLGWAVHIDDQSYESLQASIGFEFSNAVSASWGVFIPQGYIDVVSELKDGSKIITGRFLGDTSEDLTGLSNNFALQTDDFEETFARAGLGFGLVLKNNKSAFFMVDGDLGRDLLQTYYINAGFRWQF